MTHVGFLALTLVVQAGVKPLDEGEAVTMGKARAVVVTDTPVRFEVDGAGVLVLEVRGQGNKPESVEVRLTHKDGAVATAQVELKLNKKGAPKDWPLFGVVALPRDEGRHEISVTASR